MSQQFKVSPQVSKHLDGAFLSGPGLGVEFSINSKRFSWNIENAVSKKAASLGSEFPENQSAGPSIG